MAVFLFVLPYRVIKQYINTLTQCCLLESVYNIYTHHIYHGLMFVPPTSQGGLMSRARLPFWKIGEPEDHRFESGAHGFKTWLNQIEDFQIDTSRFLARRLALLG